MSILPEFLRFTFIVPFGFGVIFSKYPLKIEPQCPQDNLSVTSLMHSGLNTTPSESMAPSSWIKGASHYMHMH